MTTPAPPLSAARIRRDWHAACHMPRDVAVWDVRVALAGAAGPALARAPTRLRRLFAVACVTPLRAVLKDERLWPAVVEARRVADLPPVRRANGETHFPQPSRAVVDAAQSARDDCPPPRSPWSLFQPNPADARYYAAAAVVACVGAAPVGLGFIRAASAALGAAFCGGPDPDAAFARAVAAQAELLVGMGDPALDVAPAWRTHACVALARRIEAEDAWDGMGILADALEDAGCQNAAIYAHLRGPGPFAAGDCVIDGLLGRPGAEP